ncbi:hypothetical protein GIV96_13095 [Pseudomonas syringae]|nr:hypothetical protein [Pseudomonas syringae]MCF5313142.1 hypothetical protein [Pseudomonas syringae]MCF5365316.1 hypothetical protein [Pseudomonas syringae]MCF5398192.1 hypothetical protein [Pseudomonas syringae]MCF5400994.1 hypothetical protein [Pseudomonas syringae]
MSNLRGSHHSSVGTHFMTLRVIKRTQSVRNGMPPRSIGTIVNPGTISHITI